MMRTATVGLIAAVALSGTATADAQDWFEQQLNRHLAGLAAPHCSAEAVRSRNSRAYAGGRYLADESTFEGLFVLASLERECEAAVAAGAENDPAVPIPDLWTTFCNFNRVQRRHPNADHDLMGFLFYECRRALQAVASEQQEGTRCDYTSTSICHPDADCTARLSLQDEYERWLEIPLLEGLSGPSMSAELGNAPYPTVGICNAAGCNRIEVRYWVDVEGNAHVLRESGVGAWFMKIGAPVSFGASPDPSRDGQFVEVRTFGLITEVRSGTCPGAVPTGGR